MKKVSALFLAIVMMFSLFTVSAGSQTVFDDLPNRKPFVAVSATDDIETKKATVIFNGTEYQVEVGCAFAVKASLTLPKGYAVMGGKMEVLYDAQSGIINLIAEEFDGIWTTTDIYAICILDEKMENTGNNFAFATDKYREQNCLSEGRDNLVTLTFRVKQEGTIEINTELTNLTLSTEDDPYIINIIEGGKVIEDQKELAGQMTYNADIITPSGARGDIDSSENVDSADATLALQYYSGIIGSDDIDMLVADVNSDGRIDASDATLILQFFAGIITDFDSEPAQGIKITRGTHYTNGFVNESTELRISFDPYEWYLLNDEELAEYYRLPFETVTSMDGVVIFDCVLLNANYSDITINYIDLTKAEIEGITAEEYAEFMTEYMPSDEAYENYGVRFVHEETFRHNFCGNDYVVTSFDVIGEDFSEYYCYRVIGNYLIEINILLDDSDNIENAMGIFL